MAKKTKEELAQEKAQIDEWLKTNKPKKLRPGSASGTRLPGMSCAAPTGASGLAVASIQFLTEKKQKNQDRAAARRKANKARAEISRKANKKQSREAHSAYHAMLSAMTPEAKKEFLAAKEKKKRRRKRKKKQAIQNAEKLSKLHKEIYQQHQEFKRKLEDPDS